jgi:hypothetical protein
MCQKCLDYVEKSLDAISRKSRPDWVHRPSQLLFPPAPLRELQTSCQFVGGPWRAPIRYVTT